MKKCVLHPGRTAVVEILGKSYCKPCQDGQTAAGNRVDKHVEPKPCFIWYTGGKDGWQPISGTGCAHWVSHQKGLTWGTGNEKCLEGYTFRVQKVTFHLTIHVDKVEDVQAGDIWVNPGETHMGIVSKVATAAEAGARAITIQHDSSAQGKVSENDFKSYFGGKGKFFRL